MQKDNILQIPATLKSIRSRVDKSYTVSFDTQELSPLDLAELSQSLQVYGTLAFAINPKAIEALDEIEAPEELIEFSKKTQAKRIRDSLFVLWEHKGSVGDFETYYRARTNEIIAKIQAQLPPRE